ncbi:MAG: hypothetical protein RLY14_2076 [Planctomycetota bacterium]|jgi:hypothetical protein
MNSNRHLNGDEYAVVIGMSAPGTPGDPHFGIDIGKVLKYTVNHPYFEQDRVRGYYDYGFCVPSGKHAGWVCLKNSLLPKHSRLELQIIGNNVRISLRDLGHAVVKETIVPSTEILSRGFNLQNVNDNHGLILPQQLAQYLVDSIL